MDDALAVEVVERVEDLRERVDEGVGIARDASSPPRRLGRGRVGPHDVPREHGREGARVGLRVLRRRERLGHVLALEHLEEILALDQLHREKPAPLVLAQIEQADEVRVVQLGDDAELLLEAQEPGRIVVQHHLEGDATARRSVLDLVDRPHPADAEQARRRVALRPAELGELSPHRHGDGPYDNTATGARAGVWIGLPGGVAGSCPAGRGVMSSWTSEDVHLHSADAS